MVKQHQAEGVVSRGWQYGKLAASLTGSYLGYQLQDLLLRDGDADDLKRRFQTIASQRIRDELQDLKGPGMKLGQMLSMQGLFLPEEAVEAFASLQMRAPPMHPTLARMQFKNAIGRYPEEVFKEFDRTLFGAASLGQVHRARTDDDEDVAVKIQYPAIKKSMQNDFRLLRGAVKAGRLGGIVTKPMIKELEQRIAAETDYQKEAKHLQWFRKRLAPLDYVRVPRPLVDFSNERVLTMTHLDGAHLDRWLAEHPSQEDRDRLGTRLFELFYFQILRLRRVHADPHPGNYLFTPDGQIGLIDFGCVKKISKTVSEVFEIFATTPPQQGRANAAYLIELLWEDQPPEKAPEIERILVNAFDFYRRLFPGSGSTDERVDFGEKALFDQVTDEIKEIFENGLARPELLFAKRAENGLYNLLHQLGARVNTTQVLAGMIETRLS